jgi:chorismate synthase
MSDTWGNRIKLTIFGESHGPAVGIVIDGLPAGEAIDLALIEKELDRRAPGQSDLTTTRKETDAVEILSGVFEGKTTGSAIAAVIRNHNAHSSDYNSKLRPGHADWTALLKYQGYADMRGGGHFSGRLTAPLVFAGAVAKQILTRRGIEIYGHIFAVAGIEDTLPALSPATYKDLTNKALPVFNDDTGKSMRQAILAAKDDADSVGGVIETVAFGLPGGLGDPFFQSIESVAASLFFSIPAVKGVEFGDGFAITKLRGSEANDELLINKHNDAVIAASNHNGGILGGISNGMPVIARLAIKPTASIGKPQRSVDSASLSETTINIKGRHDPSIVPRAVPVAEAALALSILDCFPADILNTTVK